VPLSEHEQHLLEQMEQALYAEDPKFASQMQGSAARARLRRRVIVGAVFVIVGLGLVFLTVVQNVVWWGAVGFALMGGRRRLCDHAGQDAKGQAGCCRSRRIRA